MGVGANFAQGFWALLPAAVWMDRRLRREAAPAEKIWAAMAVFLAGGVCLGFNPFLIFANKNAAWDIEVYAQRGIGLHPGSWVGALSRIAAVEMGTVLAAAAVCGLLAALIWGRRAVRFLAIWTILGIAVLSWIHGLHSGSAPSQLRYFYPLVGLSCLLAAVWLERCPRALRALVVSAVLLESGLTASVYLENMRRDSGAKGTRVQAAAWIEKNAARGARIGLVRFPDPAHTPVFPFSGYHLTVFDSAQALQGRPSLDFIIADEEGRPVVESLPRGGYELAAQFLPFELGWLRMRDDASFVNEKFYIYRAKARGGLAAPAAAS
jgi:hypothetical protein